MVNYRGPKILQSICESWNLDWFDRVVKIRLYERPERLVDAVGQFSELETLTLESYSTEWLATGAEFESKGAEVFLVGYDSEGRFWPYGLVVSGPGKVGPVAPPQGSLRLSLDDYRKEQETRVAATVDHALQNALKVNPITCELGSESLVCSVKAQAPESNK
ncbi:MAG: hypothetical protein JNL67_03160 [Planctomycetaceae bacterium]|nr:hypothetical protein [Planctomycetaceae bacterium]